MTDLLEAKRQGRRVVMLTAYDYAMARLADAAGVDAILVGDSLGMVMLGHPTTLPVTMDVMVHHTRAVARAGTRALVIADMPFLSYQVSEDEAVRNAGRLVQEGGAAAVKVEGGGRVAALVERLTAAGIPVMGHLGMTPQSVHGFGGFRLQAKDAAAARKLLDDARTLEAAGAFALVLEVIPAEVAAAVSRELQIPTIGIGAGAGCDGQVQVLHDVLGLLGDFKPRHARRYLDGGQLITEALARYAEEVRGGAFPADENSFRRPDLANPEKW